MKVEGQNAAHVVAFAREYHGKVLLTIAARWFASYCRNDSTGGPAREPSADFSRDSCGKSGCYETDAIYECPDGSGGSYRGSERCIAAERRRQPGKLTCVWLSAIGIGTEMMSNALGWSRLERFAISGQVEIRPSAWHW